VTAKMTAKLPDVCGRVRITLESPRLEIEPHRTPMDGYGHATRGLQNRLWALRIQGAGSRARLYIVRATGNALDKRRFSVAPGAGTRTVAKAPT
jgi:hypothetical protein